MAAMTSRFNISIRCVIQYYSDQWCCLADARQQLVQFIFEAYMKFFLVFPRFPAKICKYGGQT